MDQIKIGKFIAELRKSKNMTQEELAEMIGVSSKSVSRWENGRNLPDPSLYNPICDVLEISITEFFNGERIEQDKLVEKAEESIVSSVNYTKEKIHQVNKKLFVMMTVFVLLLIGVVLVFDKVFYTPCSYHNGDVSQWQEGFPAHSAYQMALNSDNKPVFINPDKALKQAKTDYSDTLKIIREEYHLFPLSKYYYKPYGTYGWQIASEDDMINKQGCELSTFIDIYENSFN